MEGKRCAEYDASYTPPAGHVPNEKDDILLFYTPGTTGKYKGCLFNHTSVTYAMTAVKNASKASMSDVFYTQHHYSNPFNLIHYMLAPLLAGATVFISDQTDFATVLSNIVEMRVTRMAPNMAHLLELLKFSESEKMPIVSVKYFSFTGVSLPKDTFELLKRLTKIGVINVYGMTEYLGTIAMGNPETLADSTKPGFIGSALAGTRIRLVDDNNDEVDKKQPQKGQWDRG
jgi:acyl-coenzyme A synthetase/AMP-(fatty) acid ligase